MNEKTGLCRYKVARSYRIALVRENGMGKLRDFIIRLPLDAATAAREFLGEDLDREVFDVLLLSTRHHVIGHNRVSVGTLTASLVHPREVLKAAILANACAIIAVHNHPSGDPSPSGEDRELTDKLQAACRLMRIDLLDHVILGSDPNADSDSSEISGKTYYSFKEAGIL